MSEYNWKKEKSCVRCESSAPVSEPDFQTRPVAKGGRKRILLFLFLACLLAGALFWGFQAGKQKEKNPPPAIQPLPVDSAKALAEAAEKYRHAIALVGLSAPEKNFFLPIGTAWAINKTQFVTNGHVVEGSKKSLMTLNKKCQTELLAEMFKKAGVKTEKEYIQKFGAAKYAGEKKRIADAAKKMCSAFTIELRINGENLKSLPATHVQIHPEYIRTNFKCDLGIIHVAKEHDTFFNIAPEKTLHDLKSGEPVGSLGFPMENIPANNVNIQNPIASMQTGIIVAVSDFALKDSGSKNNFFIRHNVPCSGGASGSPLFNRKGMVVGVLNAITTIPGTRVPSGSLINYGVRIDVLSGIGPKTSVKEYLTIK